MMNVKRYLISTAIVLLVLACGFYNTDATAAEKINARKKSAKVSPKYLRSRAAGIRLRNTIVYKQLQQSVDLSALTLNTTFKEAIDLLCNSTRPPLKIVVMWRDLGENAYVEPDTPIKIDGVPDIRLRAGLEILLRSVYSGFGELGYVIQDGIIIIATKESLPAKMVTRVYDISYLVGRPARYGFGFGPGLPGGWQGRSNWDRINGRDRTNRINNRSEVRRRTRRGSFEVWGREQSSQRAGRISALIRDTVRPNSWR